VQSFGELTRDLGLGSVVGFVASYSITRRTKRQDALQAIQVANYREIVDTYALLASQVTRIISNARIVARLAGEIASIVELGNEQFTELKRPKIDQRLNQRAEQFEVAANELGELISRLAVHQNNRSVAFNMTRLVKMFVDSFQHDIEMFKLTDDPTHAQEAREHIDDINKWFNQLQMQWNKWKKNTERDISGFRASTWHRIKARRARRRSESASTRATDAAGAAPTDGPERPRTTDDVATPVATAPGM
jgi:hypothetical protein